MITTKTENKYYEWLNTEDMHSASKKWLSELNFIRDEHLFFENLVTEQTSLLIQHEDFNDTLEIVDILNKSQKKNIELIKNIELHEKNLEIMVDGVDELEKERLYKKQHRQLLTNVSDYLYEYKKVKTQLFSIVTDTLKKQKQNRLLENK